MLIKLFGKTVFETKSTEIGHQDPPAPEVIVKDFTPESYSKGGTYSSWYTHSYNGEKNFGEMGPIKEYYCDYDALRARSWQLYLDSDICQLVFRRFSKWMIGSGLKLQCEPQEDVLKSEKITGGIESFNDMAESRFSVYSESEMGDYSGMSNLHKIAARAHLNAIIGGDTLVVLRLEKNQVTVQLIDGGNVCNPGTLNMVNNEFLHTNGNRIKHGVEIDNKGKHVAYHVRTGMLNYERIPARGAKSGRLMAFMVYGLEYRLDDVRGIPLISAVMETAKKMDRYKEATLGSAEERQKIAYSIEHNEISDGSNPMLDRMAASLGAAPTVPTVDGTLLAKAVTATTNKQAVNMPAGASLRTLESKNELYFENFFSVNIMLVCATVGIPKDVALMQYESNYSSSRASIKDWEHTLGIGRKDFADQFYKNIYALWLDKEVLSNKISAPGYLDALMKDDKMILGAYRAARWAGANVPHIDPLKEVMAERAKLGDGSTHLPLTTIEAATEALNGGESWLNLSQYAKELAKATGLGIEKVQKGQLRIQQD